MYKRACVCSNGKFLPTRDLVKFKMYVKREKENPGLTRKEKVVQNGRK